MCQKEVIRRISWTKERRDRFPIKNGASPNCGESPLNALLPRPTDIRARSPGGKRVHPRHSRESKCLRKREGGKGTRLIVWQSLKDYLARRE
jgi:hypothetical protein